MTTEEAPDYYSEALLLIGKAMKQTDQQAARVSFAQVFASLALVDEQRETNALLARILDNQKTDEIIYKLEDVGNKVFAAGHW
jgi:fructose-1,6-bisphosphatase/sedoheptulose 1,7-bisphosphatase-like protein